MNSFDYVLEPNFMGSHRPAIHPVCALRLYVILDRLAGQGAGGKNNCQIFQK